MEDEKRNGKKRKWLSLLVSSCLQLLQLDSVPSVIKTILSPSFSNGDEIGTDSLILSSLLMCLLSLSLSLAFVFDSIVSILSCFVPKEKREIGRNSNTSKWAKATTNCWTASQGKTVFIILSFHSFSMREWERNSSFTHPHSLSDTNSHFRVFLPSHSTLSLSLSYSFYFSSCFSLTLEVFLSHQYS